MIKAKLQDAYSQAGVNIDVGHKAVQKMKRHVKTARTKGMITDIGSFGGLFQLPAGYKQPVLVGSTDGVGTKVLIAAQMKKYDTVGQDLVNHCVDDILVQGAKPLFFMDYFATGKLDPVMAEQLVKGLARACRENECALLGGETAEMPGVYQHQDFDLAGTIVGIVDKKQIIDGARIKPGDVILGLPSTGLHTNGYSLARQLFFKKLKMTAHTYVPELKATVGEALLAVHRSYLQQVSHLSKKIKIKGMAHITGGGFIDNIPRILPQGCRAVIRQGTWPVLPVFDYIQSRGRVDMLTMMRTFNMGIGLTLILDHKDKDQAMKLFKTMDEAVYDLGVIESGSNKTVII